jgi:cytochrome b involved in lipid metabolism
MKKITIIILGIIAVTGIGFGGWYYLNFQKYAPVAYVTDAPSETVNKDTNTEAVSTSTKNIKLVPSGLVTKDTNTGEISTSVKNFTLSELSIHKDAVSCYSAISGSVYDLTMWVNMHPGGKGPILSLCGVDGTEKFMNKHQGKPKFMTILARFKIGTFTQ